MVRRPIIQTPGHGCYSGTDWQIKPDLIIETGIAHGGSLIMSASMLALLDMCDAIDSGLSLDPIKTQRKVVLQILISVIIIDEQSKHIPWHHAFRCFKIKRLIRSHRAGASNRGELQSHNCIFGF